MTHQQVHHHQVGRWMGLSVLMVVAWLAVWPARVAAQTDSDGPPPADPEDVTLQSKDGLQLAARFFPGSLGKDSIPIVLIHDIGGRGSDFDGLAQFLQSSSGGGNSVIVPDLRGHGGSIYIQPTGSREPIKLSGKQLTREDLQLIIQYDLEAVKRYLLEQHQAKQLNIEGLTVIGAGAGGLLAMEWTIRDWSYPRLPGIKQGQDVKAVGLLSPVSKVLGANTLLVAGNPVIRDVVGVFIAYGDGDSRGKSTAKRLYNSLSKNRRTKFRDDDDQYENQDLFLVSAPTNLRGPAILTESDDPGPSTLSDFIDRRVGQWMESDFPWQQRDSVAP